MDLSVIIVSWNVREKLRENLKALFLSQGVFSYEIFVVDNNSSDGSAAMIKKEFPRVRLIENKTNLGFARANNQALREAKGELVLLLNPDMRVFPDTLARMIRWMGQNPDAAVAGCNLLNENGGAVKHVRRFPRLSDQLAIILKLPHLFPGLLKKYLKDDFDYSHPAKVDSIRGGFFMINRKKVDELISEKRKNGQAGDGGSSDAGARSIGADGKAAGEEKKITLPYLDERYFLWFEEVDYCRQIAQAGGEVWYTPVARAVDFVGQSFKQVKRSAAQKYFSESMIQYFSKWHPAWQSRILRISWPIGLFLAAIGEKLRLAGRAKT